MNPFHPKYLQPALPLHCDPTLPKVPCFGSFAEAVLAVLRLGYAVVVQASPEQGESAKQASIRLVESLWELGWPIKGTPMEDGEISYRMDTPYVPPWVYALPIPIITMREH